MAMLCTELLETWSKIMERANHLWSYRNANIMLRYLRSTESRVYIEENYLLVIRIVVSRWHAAHDNIETRHLLYTKSAYMQV